MLAFDTLKRLNAQVCGAQGRRGLCGQPALDPRSGHDGRVRVLHPESRSGDPRVTDGRGEEFPRQGAGAARVAGVNTTFRGSSQQLFVDLDRNKAEVLGVKVSDVFSTLQAYFGSQVAGQFSLFSRVWFVMLQADAEYRWARRTSATSM